MQVSNVLSRLALDLREPVLNKALPHFWPKVPGIVRRVCRPTGVSCHARLPPPSWSLGGNNDRSRVTLHRQLSGP